MSLIVSLSLLLVLLVLLVLSVLLFFRSPSLSSLSSSLLLLPSIYRSNEVARLNSPISSSPLAIRSTTATGNMSKSSSFVPGNATAAFAIGICAIANGNAGTTILLRSFNDASLLSFASVTSACLPPTSPSVVFCRTPVP